MLYRVIGLLIASFLAMSSISFFASMLFLTNSLLSLKWIMKVKIVLFFLL